MGKLDAIGSIEKKETFVAYVAFVAAVAKTDSQELQKPSIWPCLAACVYNWGSVTTQSDVLRVHQLGELLDYDSAAVLLSVSKRTLQRLVRSGSLKPVYISRRAPRFRIEDIAEFRMRGIQPPSKT